MQATKIVAIISHTVREKCFIWCSPCTDTPNPPPTIYLSRASRGFVIPFCTSMASSHPRRVVPTQSLRQRSLSSSGRPLQSPATLEASSAARCQQRSAETRCRVLAPHSSARPRVVWQGQLLALHRLFWFPDTKSSSGRRVLELRHWKSKGFGKYTKPRWLMSATSCFTLLLRFWANCYKMNNRTTYDLTRNSYLFLA